MNNTHNVPITFPLYDLFIGVDACPFCFAPLKLDRSYRYCNNCECYPTFRVLVGTGTNRASVFIEITTTQFHIDIYYDAVFINDTEITISNIFALSDFKDELTLNNKINLLLAFQ